MSSELKLFAGLADCYINVGPHPHEGAPMNKRPSKKRIAFVAVVMVLVVASISFAGGVWVKTGGSYDCTTGSLSHGCVR